jgi:hypothetical protein
VLILAIPLIGGCRSAPPPAVEGGATPVYNKDTGALEQLISDRDGDGTIDTRAFMDGVRLKHIEIDLNADGRPDRWEFYLPAPAAAAAGAPAAPTQLSHVEEAGAFDARITRREFYQNGALVRVEEDTDINGRADKWEFYEAGTLTRIDLDLVGKGAATQRLHYRPDGSVSRVETDPEGDGTFSPVTREAGTTRKNGA